MHCVVSRRSEILQLNKHSTVQSLSHLNANDDSIILG
jgi:hypothetical protein